MKNISDNAHKKSTGLQQWITLRVSVKEKKRITEQATFSGMSTSEYIRHKLFGGRPIVAHTDATTVRELRRIGGLLKHNFDTLRQAKTSSECLQQQEDILRMLASAINKIGSGHGS